MTTAPVLALPDELIPTLQRRIEAKVQHSDRGCLEWVGALSSDGYGIITLNLSGRRRSLPAHRASWMVHKGPIPERRVIDHLCRVRNCVNPDHLEVVTEVENTKRGIESRKRRIADPNSEDKFRTIRGFHDDLWWAAQDKARAEGSFLSPVIRRLLTEWLKEGTK